jgi:nucleoid DNA-binding protein
MNDLEKDPRMYYGTLVARISSLTGCSDVDIRKVLSALPEAVMECSEGEQVRTPLGTFKIVRRRFKRVRSPTGEWTSAPERVQARIRPGRRLQRGASNERPRTSPPEDDSDPDLEDP